MEIMEVEVSPVARQGLLLRARLIFARHRFSVAFLWRRTNSMIATTRGAREGPCRDHLASGSNAH